MKLAVPVKPGFARNAPVPDAGITSFTFSAAKLSFSRTSYRWLAVSGGRAWYQGAGIVTINGSSQPAEFLVAAEDGPSFTQDMLRMKIWTAAGVIYDSQPGGSDGSPAAALVTSGPASVVVR